VSSRRRAPRSDGDWPVGYRRAIYLANVTGLATREHYERSFGHLGEGLRRQLCGQVPFALALRSAGVACEGLIEVAMHPLDVELPSRVLTLLIELNEIVEATGTQVLAMREAGGPEAERFTVSGRRECGVLMVAFGDAAGTSVRELAWTSDGHGWKVSALAHDQAARHGWSRADYACLRQDTGTLLPALSSKRIRTLTAGRRPEPSEHDGASPWITYAEMAELIGG
jgi:hypothetical protein